jgi:uncharacterized radical SAM superfamily Fe-S cluster-containing enzyme
MLAEQSEERVLHHTMSVRELCHGAVPATIVADAGGEVWVHERCDVHAGAMVFAVSDENSIMAAAGHAFDGGL